MEMTHIRIPESEMINYPSAYNLEIRFLTLSKPLSKTASFCDFTSLVLLLSKLV
jgi:hypothetical protein